MGFRERVTLFAAAMILTALLMLRIGMLIPQTGWADMRFALELNSPTGPALPQEADYAFLSHARAGC